MTQGVYAATRLDGAVLKKLHRSITRLASGYNLSRDPFLRVNMATQAKIYNDLLAIMDAAKCIQIPTSIGVTFYVSPYNQRHPTVANAIATVANYGHTNVLTININRLKDEVSHE